jgi:acetyl-CoA acetyltransferase
VKGLQNRDIAIVGCAQLTATRNSGHTALELAAQVTAELVAQTGVARADMDGLATTLANSDAGNAFWTSVMCETLGLSVQWAQANELGGCSPSANIARASAAILTGQAEVVLCLAADAPTTRFTTVQTGYRQEFYDPFGYGLPIAFGLLSQAYAAKHGHLPEQGMARLAVAQRAGALDNPYALDVLRKPLSEAQYLESRMIATPLRLLDCVMRCDGGNAFLVMSTARAKRMGFKRFVHPIAYRERVNFDARQAIDDITLTGFSEVGPAALRDAGLRPEQIESFHPYDDFFIAVILQLEQIGFCAPGQAQAFIQDVGVGRAGGLPINTGGGQISAGQPGLSGGGVNLAEAVLQLMGQAQTRQLQRAHNALVTGIGVIQYGRNWGCSSALVLEAGG